MKVTRVLGRIGGIFVPFRNPKKLLGWKQLKENYQNVGLSAAEVFQRKKPTTSITESFDEAVRRLNLTPEALEARKKTLLRVALLYFAIAVGLFVYTIVLLSNFIFLGALVSLILVVVALALAYREHFWFTQMKHRRLGLKFQDWLDYTFRGKK